MKISSQNQKRTLKKNSNNFSNEKQAAVSRQSHSEFLKEKYDQFINPKQTEDFKDPPQTINSNSIYNNQDKAQNPIIQHNYLTPELELQYQTSDNDFAYLVDYHDNKSNRSLMRLPEHEVLDYTSLVVENPANYQQHPYSLGFLQLNPSSTSFQSLIHPQSTFTSFNNLPQKIPSSMPKSAKPSSTFYQTPKNSGTPLNSKNYLESSKQSSSKNNNKNEDIFIRSFEHIFSKKSNNKAAKLSGNYQPLKQPQNPNRQYLLSPSPSPSQSNSFHQSQSKLMSSRSLTIFSPQVAQQGQCEDLVKQKYLVSQFLRISARLKDLNEKVSLKIQIVVNSLKQNDVVYLPGIGRVREESNLNSNILKDLIDLESKPILSPYRERIKLRVQSTIKISTTLSIIEQFYADVFFAYDNFLNQFQQMQADPSKEGQQLSSSRQQQELQGQIVTIDQIHACGEELLMIFVRAKHAFSDKGITEVSKNMTNYESDSQHGEGKHQNISERFKKEGQVFLNTQDQLIRIEADILNSFEPSSPRTQVFTYRKFLAQLLQLQDHVNQIINQNDESNSKEAKKKGKNNNISNKQGKKSNLSSRQSSPQGKGSPAQKQSGNKIKLQLQMKTKTKEVMWLTERLYSRLLDKIDILIATYFQEIINKNIDEDIFLLSEYLYEQTKYLQVLLDQQKQKKKQEQQSGKQGQQLKFDGGNIQNQNNDPSLDVLQQLAHYNNISRRLLDDRDQEIDLDESIKETLWQYSSAYEAYIKQQNTLS